MKFPNKIPQKELDEVKRLQKKLRILGKKKKSKYYGDQYLIMNDFFEELNPELRYLFFGGAITSNQLNLMYGQLGPVAESLEMVLLSYMNNKKEMIEQGLDIQKEMMKKTRKPVEFDIYK